MYTSTQNPKSFKSRVKNWRRSGFIAIILVFSLCASSAQNTIHTDETIVRHDDKKVWKHNQSNGLNSFNIEYKGTIDVTDDDQDIRSISPGGYLEISKTTFGSKRSLLIESTSSGLRREYYENRTKKNFEPDGKNWLAEILPEVVRTTGIAAESRVNRFYKKGGVDAVISEIKIIKSDYVRAIYGKTLIKKDGLSSNELTKIVKGVSSIIDSDYYLAEMLKDNSELFLKNDKTAEAYFEAVANISSDYYSAVILKQALECHQPNEASVKQIMAASKNIRSDYYQASVLANVLDLEGLESAVMAEIISNTRNIDSDYYQSQVLSKALAKKGLSGESYNQVLDAISEVSSDYYMATVFSKLLEDKLDDVTNAKLILLINEKMSSPYYAATVLNKMVSKQELKDSSVDRLAVAISGMNSPNYAASIIIKSAETQGLSKKTLLSMIKAAGTIKSDYYMASALQSLAPQVKISDNDVKEAYRSTAKGINSNTYYGQAMRAID